MARDTLDATAKISRVINKESNAMINFNKDLMTKATFNQSFTLSDDKYGVVAALGDDAVPGEDFVDTLEGQECWIFNGITAQPYNDEELLFVYIPEFDIATTIASTLIDK